VETVISFLDDDISLLEIKSTTENTKDMKESKDSKKKNDAKDFKESNKDSKEVPVAPKNATVKHIIEVFLFL